MAKVTRDIEALTSEFTEVNSRLDSARSEVGAMEVKLTTLRKTLHEAHDPLKELAEQRWKVLRSF